MGSDGSAIAFIRFDESQVKEFPMNMFEGQASAIKENEVYPSVYSYKYPKAGEAIRPYRFMYTTFRTRPP